MFMGFDTNCTWAKIRGAAVYWGALQQVLISVRITGRIGVKFKFLKNTKDAFYVWGIGNEQTCRSALKAKTK